MKIQPFKHYNMVYMLPAINVTYETNYYLSIEIAWIKWGISIVLKDK